MSEKQREPFRSSVTNFDDLRKRMDELGIRRDIGTKNGVDVTQPEVKPEAGHYTYDG